MKKTNAKELARIINYFANQWQHDVWEAEISPYFDKEWQIEVKLKNTAFRHELNALMMIVNNTVTTSAYQKMNDKDDIVWKVW